MRDKRTPKDVCGEATPFWAFKFLFDNLFNVFNRNRVILVVNPEITQASVESLDALGVLKSYMIGGVTR